MASRRIKQWERQLRDFHQLGKGSRQKHPDRLEYGSRLELEGSGFNTDTLRKARVFATECPKSELNQLIRQCKKSKYAPGPAQISRLMNVPKKARARFQKRMIEEKWSKGRIDLEIRTRFGTRKEEAGRTVKPPANVPEALYRLLQACKSWERVRIAVDGSKLPAELEKHLKVAGSALVKLAELTKEHLDKDLPVQSTSIPAAKSTSKSTPKAASKQTRRKAPKQSVRQILKMAQSWD